MSLTKELLNELKENKSRILQNYKIRELIGKPKRDVSYRDHWINSFKKEKTKIRQISKKDIDDMCKLDDNSTECKEKNKCPCRQDLHDQFKQIIGSIKEFDEFTIDLLTCYISVVEESKELNDNREMYMQNYEEIFPLKGTRELISNFNELELNILEEDTGLTDEIMQDLIDSKEDIVKNYYYKQAIEKLPGKTYLDKFVKYCLSKNSIDKINEQAKNAPDYLFEKIIATIADFDDWTPEYLSVYSSIITNFKNVEITSKEFKQHIDKLKWKDWRYKTMYAYDDTFYSVKLNEDWNNSNAKLKYNKLVENMKRNKRNLYVCKGCKKHTFKIELKEIKKKLAQRDIKLIEIERKGNKILWQVDYDNKRYNLISNFEKVNICEDLTPHTQSEYDFFEEFIEQIYSPIYNAMDQSNNLPSGSINNNALKNRKSLIKIDSLQHVPENSRVGKIFGPDDRNIAYTVDKFKDKLNTIIEGKEDSAIIENTHLRTGDILVDIMKCMRNDRFTEKDVEKAKKNFKNKEITKDQLNDIIKRFNNDRNLPDIIWGQSKANFHREPFMKYVLHFPNNKCSGTDDSILLNTVKRELNNALVCIREKNPIDKNKEYFLIGLEGGGDMHFDYALYAFTESQLNQSENTMMTKDNLWKKLEFKSNDQGAKSISGLSGFITKSIDKLFNTYRSTFYKDFVKNINNKKWLKNNINGSEYFAKAIENTLKGQKNKTFIIWNVESQKIYLDEFKDDELIIKRINKIPQISLDENYFDKNSGIKIIIEMKKEKIELKLARSFNFEFIPNKYRKNIYDSCFN